MKHKWKESLTLAEAFRYELHRHPRLGWEVH